MQQGSNELNHMSNFIDCSKWEHQRFWVITFVVLLVTLVICLTGCDQEQLTELNERSKLIETSARFKYVMLALDKYKDKNNAYPNHLSKNHSWRVEILGLIKHVEDAPAFDKTKPWNSDENKISTETNIPAYTSHRAESQTSNFTNVILVVDEGTVFHKHGALSNSQINDGLSGTAVMLEMIDSDIAWSEPRDISIDQAIKVIQKFPRPEGPVVGFADGSISTISPKSSAEKIRAIFLANDGKTELDFL